MAVSLSTSILVVQDHNATALIFSTCACRKSNPGILVMQPAQDWATENVPGAIDGRETGASFSRDRCVRAGGGAR
jgi:hypothetical protein